MLNGLLLRNAELEGTPGWDVRVENGIVREIGRGLKTGGEVIDAAGGALLPGLHDRHIHLLATAASRASASLEGARSLTDLIWILRRAADGLAEGSWLRGTGLDLTAYPDVTIDLLDRLFPRIPVRIQDRTGALWLLNSAAMTGLASRELPAGFERDGSGELTGRVWREDTWMAEHVPRAPPCLAGIGRELAACGVTAVTDASASQTRETAAILAAAHRSGALPQRLILMSAAALSPPEDGVFEIGPVKLLIDERNLPDLDTMCRLISQARLQDRAVAVHCVTEAELVLTLAAFEATGTVPGDRIEHGSVISASAISVIRELGLKVATQPAFIMSRGDRYARTIEPDEHENLYRCASLMAAGITVYGSSDAPYGPLDPWSAMRAATGRLTRGGLVLGASEKITPAQALGIYLGPGIRVGSRADLCLLNCSLETALRDLSADHVACTLIGGQPVFTSGSGNPPPEFSF